MRAREVSARSFFLDDGEQLGTCYSLRMVRASQRSGHAVFAVVFFAFAIAVCVLVTLAPGSIPYRVTKVIPLLMLCAARLRDRKGRFELLVGFGFLASLVGDAVIDGIFIGGLVAFLVAHLFYLGAMGLPERSMGTAFAKLPALVFGGVIWWILVGSGRAPEPLRGPITAYAIVISTMLGRSIGRGFVGPKDLASRIFFLGAVLFVLSDTLIGVNRWVYPIHFGRVWILATYYTGQFLIFWGTSMAPSIEPVAGDDVVPNATSS